MFATGAQVEISENLKNASENGERFAVLRSNCANLKFLEI
jgi:hypothetical protein